MAVYSLFANKPSLSSGDPLNPTTQINNPFQGVQDEVELVRGDYALDGVVSGLNVTVGTTLATVGTGRAYVAGKRYGDSTATVSFSGMSAGTCKVYIDSTDDGTPYKAGTSTLASGQLCLADVTWTGTLTSAVDDTTKIRGIIPGHWTCHFPGQVTAASLAVWPVPYDIWIENVEVIGVNNSTTTDTLFDVHLGPDGVQGTTIFTTQTRRPTLEALEASYTIGVSGEPNGDRTPSAGEHLVVIADAVPSVGTVSRVGVTVNYRLL